MKQLRIGYFADGIWGHNAFRLLNADPRFKIVFICPRFDTTDMTLKGFADEFGIDYIKSANINDELFVEQLRAYDCDLFISMSFNQIFRTRVINLARLKTINCHAGKLPYYRGRNILNWALINDEKEFGITVHFVDEGIDTGDIILQRTYPITDNDDYSTLLTKAHTECASILYDAVGMLYEGTVQRVRQDSIDSVGLYCGMRMKGDEVLDWNQSSRDVFNFVRAICRPGPMAMTLRGEDEISINKVKMIDNAPCYKGIPGQVLVKKPDGVWVKTKDSVICIVEYASSRPLRVGDRLSGNSHG